MPGLYERDFFAWTQEQAAALRKAASERVNSAAGVDWENLAEEIESMGRSERRELTNRLAVLLTHLLKWEFQSDFRSKSWVRTIREQRLKLERHFRDNPSLKASLDEVIIDAYQDAVIAAADETSLSEAIFPTSCPYSVKQLMDSEFWPGK